MENQILEILKTMQQDMSTIKKDMSTMNQEISTMKQDMSTMKQEISTMKQEISTIKSDMVKMDRKIDKNTIILEEVQTKLVTIAEVQKAHMKQNERQFDEAMETADDKYSLVQAAVQRTSKDVKEIKENVDALTEITGKHEVEIRVLQKRPV